MGVTDLFHTRKLFRKMVAAMFTYKLGQSWSNLSFCKPVTRATVLCVGL